MIIHRIKWLSLLFLLTPLKFLYAQEVTDQLNFGDQSSERQHQVMANASTVIKGGLDEPARVLLPVGTSWKGGSISLVMKVDPAKQNYITIKLWGSDINENRLILLCEGKQVGYRHLGDISILDPGADNPVYNGRFTYTTTPLPLSLTKGKASVQLTVQANGRIWGYGTTFDKYQYNMRQPTRGIYALYTHTDGCFLPADIKQGAVPPVAVIKQKGDDSFRDLKERVNKNIDGFLKSDKPLNQVQMQFLAKAYHVKWSWAYHQDRAISRIIDGLDNIYANYLKDPHLAASEPSTPNPEWFGLGVSGQIISLLSKQIEKDLDKKVAGANGQMLARRDAYTQMLLDSREYHRKNRRQYTNQSMINDLYGIYYANKGIQVTDVAKAMTENDVRKYLYESVGLQPWLGSETDQGPNYIAGKNYMQLTSMGLTKELGFVGYYGEVIDWATEIYDATRPDLNTEGDEKIKRQLIKIAQARAYFRYPAVDELGFRAMRIETVIGWRDTHFPGDVTYAQRPSRDGSSLQVAAATLDPKMIGYVQQMFDDNQFFASLDVQMADKSFRTTAGLLQIPDQYDLIKAQRVSKERMPMAWGQPDIVFTDVEDGVIAIKNKNEILYASLYWRARNAINFLAQVHLIAPKYDRTAIVYQQEEFEPSGLFYTRSDWTNFGFGNGGLKYEEDIHSAHAGEKLPIAKIPEDVTYKQGQENMYAGRASFYKLQYGHYLIAMNASKEKSYELTIPANFKNGKNLVNGKGINNLSTLKVPPLATVVIYY